MDRCSFNSVGEGWLINVVIAVDVCVINRKILQADIDQCHGILYAFVKRIEWILDEGDGFQLITGNKLKLRQYYKQNAIMIGGMIKYSDKTIINSTQQVDDAVLQSVSR